MTAAMAQTRRQPDPIDEATAPESAVPAPTPTAEAEAALEFVLPPEQLARLSRLPFVQAHREGRSRTTPAETVWFDTAEASLLADGLMVEAPRRGPRVLRRVVPDPQAPWHPARRAEALALLGAQEDPPGTGGAPLVPVAAFAGRRGLVRLALPQGGVALETLSGQVRSLTLDRPVGRIVLAGPVGGVLAAARSITGELDLRPPLASLAEEARALVTGEQARPQRLGPPDTSAAETAEDAFARAVGHLLEVLHQQAARIRHDGGPEAVHQSRVALRRLRSVLRVFRRAADAAELRGFDARLRDAVGVLGPARDWDVFLGGTGRDIAEAFAGDARIEALLRTARARREAGYDAAVAMVASQAWRMLLIDGIALVLERPWAAAAAEEQRGMLGMPAQGFGRIELDRRWSRLRRAGAEFDSLTTEQLHELRLDGKRLRYAAEVFAPLFDGKRARRFLRRLARLQDGLGIANDVAVARGLVRSLAGRGEGRAWAIGAVEGWCEARAAEHRGDAQAAWERLGGRDRFWTGD